MRSIATFVTRWNDIVFIKDGGGSRSLTNDAESVTRMVWDRMPNNRIVYQDTDGHWDEMVHEEGVFKTFRVYNGWVPDE